MSSRNRHSCRSRAWATPVSHAVSLVCWHSRWEIGAARSNLGISKRPGDLELETRQVPQASVVLSLACKLPKSKEGFAIPAVFLDPRPATSIGSADLLIRRRHKLSLSREPQLLKTPPHANEFQSLLMVHNYFDFGTKR